MHSTKRVCLIDDDEDDRLFFSMGLKEFDPSIEFSWYTDSETALQRFAEKKVPLPDILFLDWNIPKLSGRQLLHAIRRNNYYDGIPIIVFTTSSAIQDKNEARRLGASYFLSKPASLKELTRHLRSIFAYIWDES